MTNDNSELAKLFRTAIHHALAQADRFSIPERIEFLESLQDHLTERISVLKSIRPEKIEELPNPNPTDEQGAA